MSADNAKLIAELLQRIDAVLATYIDEPIFDLLADCRAALSAQSPTGVAPMNDPLKTIVDRFLAWKLPEHFRPDGGISFTPDYNQHTPWPAKHEPVGTNLFTAEQARAMFEHCLAGIALSAQSEPVASDRDKDWILAMAEALGRDSGFMVPIVPEPEPFRELFAAIRAALSPPVASAQVPREPTDAMIGAGVSAYIVQSTIQAIPRYVWTAMYDAALAEPGATEGEAK